MLLYVAYGYLIFAGTGHFAIDVVRQYITGSRPAGEATTLYYGLHSAYSLGRVAFGILAVLVIRSGSDLMSRYPGQIVSFLAVAGWFTICLMFDQYMPPRINLAIVTAFLIGAAINAGRS